MVLRNRGYLQDIRRRPRLVHNDRGLVLDPRKPKGTEIAGKPEPKFVSELHELGQQVPLGLKLQLSLERRAERWVRERQRRAGS